MENYVFVVVTLGENLGLLKNLEIAYASDIKCFLYCCLFCFMYLFVYIVFILQWDVSGDRVFRINWL